VSASSSRLSRHDASLLLVSVIWGGNYSVAKLAVAHSPPLVFAAVRFVVSTGLLWLLVRWRGSRAPLERRTFWTLIGWGVVGHTLNQVSLLYGLRYTSPTNAALIFGNLPVVVALLGSAFGLERATPRVWGGIALGTVGVALVVGARGTRFEAGTRLGDLLIVASLLCWAGFTVGVRRVALGIDSARVAAITHLGGTPGLVLAAVPIVAAGRPRLDGAFWGAVTYASVLSSVVASTLWTRSLKALGGNRTALFNCVTPLFAATSAWLVFGERPVPIQAVGAGLVLVGVLLSRHPGEVEEP
jgi:drug/metabolite transporter (DMT)-like permease